MVTGRQTEAGLIIGKKSALHPGHSRNSVRSELEITVLRFSYDLSNAPFESNSCRSERSARGKEKLLDYYLTSTNDYH